MHFFTHTLPSPRIFWDFVQTPGVHASFAEVLPHARAHPSSEFLQHLPLRDRVLLEVHAVYVHGGVQAFPLPRRLLHHEQVAF